MTAAPRGRRARLGELVRRCSAPPAPLYAFLALASASMLGLAHETGLRQPAAYLAPASGPPRWIAAASACAGLVLGVALARRGTRNRLDPERALPWSAALSSVVASASGALWCVGFRGWLGALAAVLPGLGCALATMTLTITWRGVARYSQQLGIVEWALSPFRLFGTALLFGVAATVTAQAGLVRSGALLGMCIALLAAAWPPLLHWLERRPARRLAGAHVVSIGALSFASVVLLAAERLVPLQDLWRYPGEVVFTTTTARAHYVITSGQESFALFRDDRLEFSTIDDYRYAEALTHPALALARPAARVALLGGGKGIVEREVLRWPEVRELTVVTEDAALCALARELRWWRSLTEASLESARVEIQEVEPIVWLETRRDRYDVILVDLPDPTNYSEAKNYTRLFYELLRARLDPQGVVAVQGTSPLRSPQTFASVEATLRAAGFTTLAYGAQVPTLGEWGFLLAASHPLVPPRRVPPGTRFLDAVVLAELFVLPPDTQSSRAPGVTSLMNDMRILDIFERESSP